MMQQESFQIPGQFRQIAFFELLADATFHHQCSLAATDSYIVSRHARASILASILTIECVANCLLASIDAAKRLANDLDKLPALSKIDVALRFTCNTALDRGRIEVQKVQELIDLRNDYVHPKAVATPGSIGTPQDGGDEWKIPLAFDAKTYPGLRIPKLATFWTGDDALACLLALSDFYRYLFVDRMSADDQSLISLLMSRFESETLHMPAEFGEFSDQISQAKEHGVDFSYLVGASTGKSPTDAI